MVPQPHVSVERVRWADVDLVGIARFSAFTRFVEHAEQEWLREAGLSYSDVLEKADAVMPRRHLSIEYFAPARLDDPLMLVTYVSRVGETSLTFNVDVIALADGAPRASAEVVVVAVSSRDFAKKPLPNMVRDAVASYTLQRDAARAAAESIRLELAELPNFQ